MQFPPVCFAVDLRGLFFTLESSIGIISVERQTFFPFHCWCRAWKTKTSMTFLPHQNKLSSFSEIKQGSKSGQFIFVLCSNQSNILLLVIHVRNDGLLHQSYDIFVFNCLSWISWDNSNFIKIVTGRWCFVVPAQSSLPVYSPFSGLNGPFRLCF